MLRFSLSSLEESICIGNDDTLSLSKNTKFLGIFLQNSLRFDVHIDFVYGKINKLYYTIYKLRNTVDLDTLRMFYLACCQSVFDYGIILWGSSYSIEKLFKLQKRIIRCMLHLNYRESCKPHFINLNLLTLPCLYIYKLTIFCRENQHLFVKNRDTSSYTTRGTSKLCIPSHHTSMFERSPMYMMIKVYNALPTELSAIE